MPTEQKEREEAERKAKEDQEAYERDKREKDSEHRANCMNDACASMVAAGLESSSARLAVRAITDGLITNVSITF